MKIDRFTLMMTLLVVLVVMVVGASQYQQFYLNSNNNEKLNLINQALHNQTNDILKQLENHRKVTNTTRELVEDNYRILHQLFNGNKSFFN